MNFKNKTAAVVMSAVMLAGLAGCSDTTWIAKMGDEKPLSAGVYILNQLDSYYEAQAAYDKANPPAEGEAADEKAKEPDILKEQVEGVTGAQFIQDKAQNLIREHYAVRELAKEKGIELSLEDMDMIRQNNEMIWQYSGAFYEENGVSKDSAEETMKTYFLRNELFLKMYGEGGEKEVPAAELEAHYNDTKVRVRYIPFSLMEEGLPMSPEKIAEVEKTATAYLDRAKAGESMTVLINEYRKSTAEEGAVVEDLPEGGADSVLDKTAESALARELAEAPLNEVRMFRDGENEIYIGMRVDTMANPADFESAKSAMLQELKLEEFDAFIAERAKAIEVVFNNAAIKRYTPSKLKMDAGA